MVDGDRLLVIAQEKIIELAKKHMDGVNPLYYEMKKAKAQEINNLNMYKGLEAAFKGGKIGNISNDITKIWNSADISEEAKKAVRWLCMETNFTIDYAKTLFKPTRPDEVDVVLKGYGRNKVPYFFKFAKDKDDNQCEDTNFSTINKISAAINNPKNVFKEFKKLDRLNYLILIENMEDIYFDENINKIFDRWNKKYGNNIKFDDGQDTQKNNLIAIANEVRKELNSIQPNNQLVINSLVRFLYKSPSTRKKKLFWYIYGEEIYQNIIHNLQITGLFEKCICRKCGCRTDDLVDYKCKECREKEINELDGDKKLKCIECGMEFQVSAKSRRKCRCDECQTLYRKAYKTKNKRKERLRKNVDSSNVCEI